MGLRKRIFTLSSAIIAGLVTIAIGLILWSTTLSSASQGQAVKPQQDPVQLEQAADQAADLSEDVYSGLDTTKKIIGKTEARNQAIETGRDAASQKLEELSDRAQQAETHGEDVLSATDKRVLKHITE
ncbi:hypothetical protein IQ273_04090 [Nodosilinea sp. LEGE 07298]|uniref:hypothetical protein n=1 Tax=Nodosilinea sp. LEGE 07298 TaxID=2777970 RepID=UPI00187DDBFC|nr:hypothetical protein [Nodosilinea sp. LEGE 07298]MBE9108597.1 hypothetical protein [Nodosilinea sp. LEGE 07298]